MACRGSGQVISNLGGTTSTLACPWCGGGGVRVPEIDAQERWLAELGAGESAGPESAGPASGQEGAGAAPAEPPAPESQA